MFPTRSVNEKMLRKIKQTRFKNKRSFKITKIANKNKNNNEKRKKKRPTLPKIITPRRRRFI